MDEYCHPETKQCELYSGDCGACIEDYECARDGVCVDFELGGRGCLRPCISDIGCPRCFACEDVLGGDESHCVPRTASCEKPCACEEDLDCPAGEKCSVAHGDCVPGCDEDGGCAGESVCVNARCVPPCSGAEDCPAPAVCQDGHCTIPGGCVTSRDCPDPGTYCDALLHRCVAGCQRDADCGLASLVCEEGTCVEKGCEFHYQCGHGQVCRDAACEDAGGFYCAECDPNVEGSCGDAANKCVHLVDEEGNDLGDFCFVVCDDADPAGPCPQGYQCTEAELEEGQPGRYCIRACHRQPVGVE